MKTWTIVLLLSVAPLAASAFGAFSEEALYYMAPIAVAVLAYLLDHRANRRHEHFMEDTGERLRDLEHSMTRYAGSVQTSLAIVDKCLEHLTYRLEAVEGTDSGVSKEHGEALAKNLDQLSDAVASLGLQAQFLDGRLKRVEEEE